MESVCTVLYIVLRELAGHGSSTAEPSFCLCHQLAGQPCASWHVKDETRCSLITLVFFLVFIFLIEVYLISSVVLVSSTQQSDSVIHMCIYIYFFFLRFFSTTGSITLCILAVLFKTSSIREGIGE